MNENCPNINIPNLLKGTLTEEGNKPKVADANSIINNLDKNSISEITSSIDLNALIKTTTSDDENNVINEQKKYEGPMTRLRSGAIRRVDYDRLNNGKMSGGRKIKMNGGMTASQRDQLVTIVTINDLIK